MKHNPVSLSLCMIARDSSRTLEAALASVRPWVDEIVLVDTGSRDDTPQIALRLGARVFHFPWCDDFAAARNESLRHARGRWLFWMDSDDTIDAANGENLRSLSRKNTNESPLGYVMQVHCPGPVTDGVADVTIVDHVKMFQNRPELQFEGRIHEQILPSIRRLNGEVGWSDIFVVHSGSDQSPEGRRRKQDRDLRLLELDIHDRPDHPFVLFNLGMTYADMGNHQKAIDALQRSLAVSSTTESHVRKVHALLASSLYQLGRTNEAWQCCQSGLSAFPQDPELLFRAGIAAQRLNQLEAAAAYYRNALADKDKRHFSSRDSAITGYKARHNLAVVCGELGQHDLAELEWRQIVAQLPNYRAGWRGLHESLVAQRKLTTLEVETERAQQKGHLQREVALTGFRLAESRGDYRAALCELEKATKDFPNDLEILRAYCRVLFEHGDLPSAERALVELCDRQPQDGAVLHNLGTIYVRQGRFAEALKAYEQSLRMRPGHAPTQQQLDAVRLHLDSSATLMGAAVP